MQSKKKLKNFSRFKVIKKKKGPNSFDGPCDFTEIGIAPPKVESLA